MRLFIIALVSLLIISLSEKSYAEGRQLDLNIPQEVIEYSKLYKEVRNSTKPVSLEELFKMGEIAKKAFLKANSNEISNSFSNNHESSLEKMADIIPAYKIGSGAEQFYYYADTKKFADLAKKHGTKEDIKFFALYYKTFPYGDYWPGYMEQVTDISGCLKKGTAEHDDFKPLWEEFIKNSKSEYYKSLARNYIEIFESHREMQDCNDPNSHYE